MSDQPTFEEELVRKAGDALCWLDNEYKRGAISKEAFHTALVGVDICTLGLIPVEYSDWATEARQSALNARYPDKVVLTMLGVATLVVELDRAWGAVKVTKISDAKGIEAKTITPEESDSVRAASVIFPTIVDNLIKKGFEVIK